MKLLTAFFYSASVLIVLYSVAYSAPPRQKGSNKRGGGKTRSGKETTSQCKKSKAGSETAKKKIQVRLDQDDYVCRHKESGETDTLTDTLVCDFVPCELKFIDTSLQSAAKNEFASFVFCDSIKTMLPCIEDTLSTCDAGPNPDHSGQVELENRISFMRENCMCNDSADYNNECQDPCRKNPCLNDGECVVTQDMQFSGCNCKAPYTGDFCQECDSCSSTCKKYNECNCPERYGGPYCNMPCDNIENDRMPLFTSCNQIANDVYFATPYPSECIYNLMFTECLAATANTCGFDVADFLADLNILSGFMLASQSFESGNCRISGKIPFEL